MDTVEIPDTLVNGGDCDLHYHQADRVPRQDTVHGLSFVTRVRDVNSSQTLTNNDDIVQCTTTCEITLPTAKGGREYEVVKAFDGGLVTVIPTFPDTVLSSDAVLIYNRGTAIRFKSVTGGYIAI